MKQEMININANLVAEPTFSNFEKDGETVEVANFTCIFRCGGAASPVWREPLVRTIGATFV